MPLEVRRRQIFEQSGETPAEHRSGEPVETKLLRIAAKARKERELKFVNLYYLMNEELLLRCFRQLSEDKAAGIDKVTKEQYAENLEANIKELVSQLHRMVSAATSEEGVHSEGWKRETAALGNTMTGGQACAVRIGEDPGSDL